MEFNPDIILADYKLPNFDGIHAILIAKEHCPDVPIIIVSGAVGEEEAIEILKSGATDFVLKDRLSSRLVRKRTPRCRTVFLDRQMMRERIGSLEVWIA